MNYYYNIKKMAKCQVICCCWKEYTACKTNDGCVVSVAETLSKNEKGLNIVSPLSSKSYLISLHLTVSLCEPS